MEIALVALDLFAEQGFETTSISQVAKAAGIGKGTIYEYFSSKEDLILNAFVAWIDSMMGDELDSLFESITDPEERLRHSVHAMMEPFIADEKAVKLTVAMFQLMLTNLDFVAQHPEIMDTFRVMRKVFADILLDGVAQGVFKPEIAPDAEKIAINLFAYLDGIAVHYFVNKQDIDLMPQVDFYVEQLLNVIRKV